MRQHSKHINYLICFFLFLLAFFVFRSFMGLSRKGLTRRFRETPIDLEIEYDRNKKILVKEDDYGIKVKEMDLTPTTRF